MARRTAKQKSEMHQQIEKAEQAIDAALADVTVLAFLADYGCTVARLREGQHLCAAAQRSVIEADNAVDALKVWMDQFLVLAETALEPRPDLIKQLKSRSKK